MKKFNIGISMFFNKYPNTQNEFSAFSINLCDIRRKKKKNQQSHTQKNPLTQIAAHKLRDTVEQYRIFII